MNKITWHGVSFFYFFIILLKIYCATRSNIFNYFNTTVRFKWILLILSIYHAFRYKKKKDKNGYNLKNIFLSKFAKRVVLYWNSLNILHVYVCVCIIVMWACFRYPCDWSVYTTDNKYTIRWWHILLIQRQSSCIRRNLKNKTN